MKYELDWSHLEQASRPYYSNRHLVSIFTGIDPYDVYDAQIEVCRLNKKSVSDAWGGQMFVKVFHFLGFNTSDRFIKFDPDTDKPCIMRCIIPGYHSQWWAFVYQDGIINNKWTIDQWQARHTNLKITSMLQIWI